MGLMDVIKSAMRTWLDIEPGTEKGAIKIEQPLSFDAHVMRNRIWYRGDPSEIESFFKQTATDSVGKSRFWAATPDLPIRKIHVDIPTQMVDRLAGIVAGDCEGFDITDKQALADWKAIAKDNFWSDLANDSIAEALATGDGAYKFSIDPAVSEFPIIEFYGADRITPVINRGRLQELIFHTLFVDKDRRYRLDEHYGKGYISSNLYHITTTKDINVPLTSIKETASLQPVVRFAGDVMIAVQIKFFDSPLWAGRGSSILATKSEAFDALDEVVSEWWDDYRKGRVKMFLPESMFLRDANTGKIKRPNEFDDLYVQTRDTISEDGKTAMQAFSPDIRSAQYQAGYAQALDMALMGVISPSTLGIDLKKTDNAEAQREKEKATLWTRARIVDTLTEAWPKVVKAAIVAFDNMKSTSPRDVDVEVMFGEYASPSFDTQLQSMGVAAQWNLLSVEATVDELWGDTKDDYWKTQEVDRIKELRGVMTVEEPATGGPMSAAKPITVDPSGITEGQIQSVLPEKTSLNGAQMQSLLSVVKSVKLGELSVTAAISLISSSLPLNEEQARSILQDSV